MLTYISFLHLLSIYLEVEISQIYYHHKMRIHLDTPTFWSTSNTPVFNLDFDLILKVFSFDFFNQFLLSILAISLNCLIWVVLYLQSLQYMWKSLIKSTQQKFSPWWSLVDIKKIMNSFIKHFNGSLMLCIIRTSVKVINIIFF